MAPIRIENLGKRYKLYPNPADRLTEWLTLNRAVRHADFWALRDFSLTVDRGQCVGVIGPNGAGKSTLLKILSGALSPTTGSYAVEGKVLSLLELGTGFRPDLTGRQNIVETASLLGFPADFVRTRVNDIADFSDLGDFLDRPIKIYSSGMTVRLAFSMFVFLEPDIFIVDEALAVGDAGFQRRCYQRIEQMLQSGVTCLLVTHDLPAIVRFCHRAVVLEHGRKTFDGDPRHAVNKLNDLYFGLSTRQADEPTGDGSAVIEDLWFEDGAGDRIGSARAGRPVVFCHHVRFTRPIPEAEFGMHIKTTLGVEVTTAGTEKLGLCFGPFTAGQTATVRWTLDLTLNPGNYFFGCGVRHGGTHDFMARRVDAVKFPVSDVQLVGGLVNPIRGVKVD